MSAQKQKIISACLLTAGCIGVYLTLRSLPVEACNFLHYGDYVNDAGIIEGCGYEEVGFFDLQTLRFPVTASITTLEPPSKDHPGLFQIQLETVSGTPIDYENLVVSHTERLHAMIVDSSLQDYQHIHPRDGGQPGTYLFDFQPQSDGLYQVFLDFIPLKTSRRTLITTQFQISEHHLNPLIHPTQLEFTDKDFSYTLIPSSETFTVGQSIPFSLQVNSLHHQTIQFGPVMDSFAHIVAFDPSLRGFAHFHPLNPLIENQDPSNPELDFLFSVDRPGYYRVWAQVSINGEERFIPFDIQATL